MDASLIDANTPLIALVLVLLAVLGIRVRPATGPDVLRSIAETLDKDEHGHVSVKPGSPGEKVLDAIEARLRAGVRHEIDRALQPHSQALDGVQGRAREHSERIHALELEAAELRGFRAGQQNTPINGVPLVDTSASGSHWRQPSR